MKLSRFSFARYWQVHALAGVITSLVVYVMFVLGAVTLFYRPLTVWEEPLVQRPALKLEKLQSLLELAAPLPEEFYLYLPDAYRALPKIGYFLPGTTQWTTWWLDVEQHRAIPQREFSAGYIYDLHYLWHAVTGYWLQYGAGVLVFGFLLAIVTGVLIQLRNLTRQLNQFRPQRSTRTLFSDMHKVIGVLGLPFQLVYALTGSMMVLSPLLFQLSLTPVFGGDTLRGSEIAGALVDELPPREQGERRVPLPLDTLVALALAAEPRLEPDSIAFRNYPFEVGTVDVRGDIRGQPFADGFVRLCVHDGHVELVETPDHSRAVGTVAAWLHSLHTVHYGGIGMRVLLALLALGGCITILTGNWIWLARRAQPAQSARAPLLARLTAGIGAGVPVAVASLLLASRLLSWDWPARGYAEELVFAGALAACLIWALTSRDTVSVWWQQLLLAALLLACVPVAAATSSVAGLFGGGPRIALVTAVELGFVIVSGLLLTTALAVRRATRRSPVNIPQPAAAGLNEGARQP